MGKLRWVTYQCDVCAKKFEEVLPGSSTLLFWANEHELRSYHLCSPPCLLRWAKRVARSPVTSVR